MLRFSANISLLFAHLPLLDRFQAARAAGFDAVEIQNPYVLPAPQLANAAEDAGVKIILINTPIDTTAATPGIASRPDKAAEFIDGLKRAQDYAAVLGVERVNILAGPAGTEDQLVESLSLAADTMGRAGVKVMLEAINGVDHPAYAVQTPQTAMDVIRRCASDNLFLQFDVYHVAMMGLDPVTEFEKALPYIDHIQFADVPGRHEPGTGAVDFRAFFRAARATSYTGWIGAEFHPTGQNIKWDFLAASSLP